jgi:hypothetical protein
MAGQAFGDWPANVIPLARAAMPLTGEIRVDADTLELVRQARVLLRQSQLKPRNDFDHACSLIAGDKGTTTERYAAAFFQGLQLFALRRLKFFPAKADTVSQDEMWLVRLLIALRAEDYTSAKYLMALRVAPLGHRRLLFLAEKLADILCPAHLRHAMLAAGVGPAVNE